MDWQGCVIKTVASSPRTDTRHTHVTRTDKSLKTEGPKILSNYIFYFKTVIIGGPIWGETLNITTIQSFLLFVDCGGHTCTFEKS